MFLEPSSFPLKARQQIPLFARLHESQKYLCIMILDTIAGAAEWEILDKGRSYDTPLCPSCKFQKLI